MALAELQREGLEPIERFPRLIAKGTKLVRQIQTTVTQKGTASTAFLLMVIASGLKLMWSNHFPLGWWIILGVLMLNEIGLTKMLRKSKEPQLGVPIDGRTGQS